MKKFESIVTSIFIYFAAFIVGIYSGRVAMGNDSVLLKTLSISVTVGFISWIVFIITKNDEIDCITSFIWRLKKEN